MVKVQTSQDMLDEMQQQTNYIRMEIKAAQDRQKIYADLKRTDHSFDIGDMVFLKILPKRISLSAGKFRKLKPRYCGTYVITNKINDQAYELLLPPNLKVHNVFDVNLLEKYIPDANHTFEEDELHVTKEGVIDIQPKTILQTRTRKLQNRSINEYLIKWLGYPTNDATWEYEETLLENYPDCLSR